MAQFIAMEASLLQPRRLVLGHHDNWLGRSDYPLRERLFAAARLLSDAMPKNGAAR